MYFNIKVTTPCLGAREDLLRVQTEEASRPGDDQYDFTSGRVIHSFIHPYSLFIHKAF